MSFSQSILPEFDQEMKNTRKILECVPDGKMDYKPHPKSMSIAQVATHIADMAGWAGPAVDLDVLDIPSDYKPHIARSRAELLQIFDKNVAESRPKIEATSDEKWQQTWKLKFGGHEVISMPRAAVLRGAILNHIIHHRAQLGVFLRLNDVAIPGMYGPSADEMPMNAAAS